jgi:hypothetical protein
LAILHNVGISIDDALSTASVCVIDPAGEITARMVVPVDADLGQLLLNLYLAIDRVGIASSPISQEIVDSLTASELLVTPLSTADPTAAVEVLWEDAGLYSALHLARALQASAARPHDDSTNADH